MKNITHLFKSALLVSIIVLAATFYSCKKSFMYSDYTYELKAETKAPATIYKNTPIPFELKMFTIRQRYNFESKSQLFPSASQVILDVCNTSKTPVDGIKWG